MSSSCLAARAARESSSCVPNWLPEDQSHPEPRRRGVVLREKVVPNELTGKK